LMHLAYHYIYQLDKESKNQHQTNNSILCRTTFQLILHHQDLA